jgi:hypothetical protein
VIATQQDHDQAAILDDHRQGFDEGAVRQPKLGRDRLDLAKAGRGDGLGRVQRRRQLDRLRRGGGDLDVGSVARSQRHLVLAGGAGRHVLVGAGAAHHPNVGLDLVPAQPAAIEDALVGARL